MAALQRQNIFGSFGEPPKVAVVGVGGGGGNAVNNMIANGLKGVSFVVINTDNQALIQSKAGQRIQAGQALTRGLGAGSRPKVGSEAVEESRTEIEQALQGHDMVFVVAGMGGGTGTGGAPVVGQMARDLGAYTVAIVTTPFHFEGRKRMKAALQGITSLREHIDAIVVVAAQRLLEIDGGKLSIFDAFLRADEALFEATRGISDLVITEGLINLDLEDVRTVMSNGTLVRMGSATAAGHPDSGRAERAANDAIRSPLFEDMPISGARSVLVNITGNGSLGVGEAVAAIDAIGREAGDDVEVNFGTVIDESMGDEVRVTLYTSGHTDHSLRGDLISGIRTTKEFAEPEIELDVTIDPGSATAEDIAELYAALSDLHRSLGGTGLVPSGETCAYNMTGEVVEQ